MDRSRYYTDRVGVMLIIVGVMWIIMGVMWIIFKMLKTCHCCRLATIDLTVIDVHPTGFPNINYKELMSRACKVSYMNYIVHGSKNQK